MTREKAWQVMLYSQHSYFAQIGGSMFGSGQISLGELARLCHRLSTSLDAGIDLRKTLARESEGRVPASVARRLTQIHQAVGNGDTLEDALRTTGEFFPTLFVRMAVVGEKTGQQPEVFRRLADHYDQQIKLRRDFWGRITWPLVQLAAAVLLVGFLIWILGVIASSRGGKPMDVLGLGLVGTAGALTWFAIVAAIFGSGVLAYVLLTRSLAGTYRLHSALLAIPVLGPALQTLALSRLAWSLHLTHETGMDLGEAVQLSLETTGNACYAVQAPSAKSKLLEGDTLTATLASEGRYPRDFLDTLEVGEESGRISESMAVLSEQYRERANAALATLTMLAGFAVWAMVALLLVVIIIRIFMVAYLQPINDLLNTM